MRALQITAPGTNDVLAGPAASVQLSVRVFGGQGASPLPVSGCFALTSNGRERAGPFTLSADPAQAAGSAAPGDPGPGPSHTAVHSGVVGDLAEGWHSGGS
jgi:hypothetical protein